MTLIRWIVIGMVAIGGLGVTHVLAQDEPSEAAAPGSDAPVSDVPDADDAPEGAAAAGQDVGNAAAIDDFLNATNAANLKERVDAFYARDVRFEDPFGTVEGRDGLLTYYKKLFDGIESVSFEIKEEFVSGDETVALWTMNLKHRSLNGAEAVSVDGVSQFRFAGNQVVFQHNYFDAGAVVYENVTFVGMLVRWVKKQVMPAG